MNIDHQLQRLSDMTLVIEPTKTSARTRKLPLTEDVAKCFQAIIEDREKPKVEKVVDALHIVMHISNTNALRNGYRNDSI